VPHQWRQPVGRWGRFRTPKYSSPGYRDGSPRRSRTNDSARTSHPLGNRLPKCSHALSGHSLLATESARPTSDAGRDQIRPRNVESGIRAAQPAVVEALVAAGLRRADQLFIPRWVASTGRPPASGNRPTPRAVAGFPYQGWRRHVLDPDADTGLTHLVTAHPSARNHFQCLPMGQRNSGELGSSRLNSDELGAVGQATRAFSVGLPQRCSDPACPRN